MRLVEEKFEVLDEIAEIPEEERAEIQEELSQLSQDGDQNAAAKHCGDVAANRLVCNALFFRLPSQFWMKSLKNCSFKMVVTVKLFTFFSQIHKDSSRFKNCFFVIIVGC